MRAAAWAVAGVVVGLAAGLLFGPGWERAPEPAQPMADAATACDAVVDGRTLVEVLLEEPPGADGAWVSSEVLLDGTPLGVRAGGELCGWRTLTRAVSPGEHSLVARGRYRRDVKILTQPLGEAKLSMTVVPGGEFDLDRRVSLSVPEGGLVRVGVSVELVPASPTDRLTLAPAATAASAHD